MFEQYVAFVVTISAPLDLLAHLGAGPLTLGRVKLGHCGRSSLESGKAVVGLHPAFLPVGGPVASEIGWDGFHYPLVLLPASNLGSGLLTEQHLTS